MPAPGFLADLTDTLLRFLPRRAPTGTFAVGEPGPDAPVLLTGNFTLTVRRLRRALQGRSAWLVVADSRGINVWCAAGGGHLTHRDVIAALEAVPGGVHTRTVLLPPMLAPGAEARLVEQATGWTVRWGPVHMDDLPTWLDAGNPTPSALQRVRFPPRDRVEMALAWSFSIAAPLVPLAAWLGSATLALALAIAVPAGIVALFMAVPRVLYVGPARWISGAGFGALAGGLGLGALALLGALTPTAGAWLVGLCLAALLGVAAEIAGTMPTAPATMDEIHKRASLALDAGRCSGCGLCVQLCPTGVLADEGGAVRIARPEACVACTACAIQCPCDALGFAPGWDPERLRGTRANLMGRRVPRP